MATKCPIQSLFDPRAANQRVTLQQPGGGVDVLGQAQASWQDVADVWAEVTPLRGREYFAAGTMQVPVDIRMRIRYRSDVVPTWRVVWRTQPHDIVSVIDVEARQEVCELMCVAGIRDGR
jgi:SPP1 family predicted phage head-tail adaptor